MFAALIENMLPPGVTVEMLTNQAGQIAEKMVKTADAVDRIESLLIELNRKLDAGQGATLQHNMKDCNDDTEQTAGTPGSDPGIA